MQQPIKRTISGWGNFPKETGFVYRPETFADLSNIVGGDTTPHLISYGLGRSYGDTSLNQDSGVIQMRELDHLLEFNEDTGSLTCDAGVSLKEIIDVFLPRGYFLPVTPGTTFVTVGGAIANDIHGKNHHVDGCFSEFVVSFELLLASGEVITCSRDENSDIFWATIGGIGLTGIILTATISLMRIPSSYIKATYEKARNLDEAFDKFIENDANYKYSVAWIDCLGRGDSLGRSVLMRGEHAEQAELPLKVRDPYEVKKGLSLNVPIHAPGFALNPVTISAFNEVYYRSFKNETKIVPLHSFFHPLDAISDWNKLYGKKGFIQYQVVIPKENEPKEAMRKILTQLSEEKRASFLAVLKSSGPENQGLLSFMKEGYTLALDIPIKDSSLFTSMKELDDIVLEHGGRVYLAKDSLIDEVTFKEMYPKWNEFINIKEKVDPNGRFSSSMARRIGLMK